MPLKSVVYRLLIYKENSTNCYFSIYLLGWETLVNQEDEEKKYKAVREFRDDFKDLIDKSKKGKIVVLIDDLDRCLPRHIIENLEAIKLFLNVPKTAFVIAADKFIV